MTVTESLPAVDAVRRALEIDERPLEGTDGSAGTRRVRVVLTLTTNISRAPAQLWPLLASPHELSHWFGPVHGELREGGRFEAPGGACIRVIQVQEPHRIGLAWDRGAGEEPVLLRLDPEDDGTTALAVRHTLELDAEEFERTGPGAIALDWELALLSLAARTDGWHATCLSPVPVPSSAWLDGPQGAAYVRAWAVRWAAESIAAGVDEESARRGEAETLRRRLSR